MANNSYRADIAIGGNGHAVGEQQDIQMMQELRKARFPCTKRRILKKYGYK